MWKLQGGSYIPGFSRQAYGAGLQRDVTKTQQDQARKAAELNKYMSKRGAMGKWGGKIASGLLGVGLGAMGMGPMGLLAAKSIGAGLGSALGSSKRLSGSGPSMKPGAGTGLLGSGYEQLSEAKGGIDESMRGQAFGAGAAQLASGLTGMAGDKLGAAFGKTGLGMDLKSGYGKMMAEKFGKNIGASPELGGGLSADAKSFHESMGAGNLSKSLPPIESMDSGMSNIGANFGLPQASQFDLGSDLDLTSNLTSDASYTGDIYRGIGPFSSQQGGYMQGYQEGGEARGALMRAFESADLNRDKIMGEAKLRNREQSRNDMTSGILQGLSNTPMEDNAPMVDMDRILAMSKIKQGMSPEEREKVDLGYASIVPPTPRSHHERLKERNKNLREEFGNDWSAVSGQYSSQQLQDMIPKYQMGGMMPGGVSNALPYQEGGEAEDKLTFGQRFVKRFPSQHEDPERAAGQERGLTSLIDFLIPQSKLDVALSALPIGALGKVGKKGIKKLIKGKRSPYNEGRTNVDMQHYTDWPENVKDDIHPSILDDVLPPRRRALGDIYDEEGRTLDLVDILESHGLQEGGYMPRYNLGGSVQQQPMAYQLGGLLKYKRSPMMG